MPDLRHVPDFLTLKVHHVHIVRLNTLAGWCAGATGAGMGAREDTVCTNGLALFISAEGLQLISSIRNKSQQTLHPVSVLLKVVHAGKRLRLRRKSRVRLAIRPASLPSF